MRVGLCIARDYLLIAVITGIFFIILLRFPPSVPIDDMREYVVYDKNEAGSLLYLHVPLKDKK